MRTSKPTFFISLFLFFFILLIIFPSKVQYKGEILGKKIDIAANIPDIEFTVFGFKISTNLPIRLGLDLEGGTHLVFEADIKKIKSEDRENALVSARNIIEKRVNFFGVSEPSIQTLKTTDAYRIVVDLPGVQDIEKAVSLIGQTATLQFREQSTSSAVISTEAAQMITLDKPTKLSGKHVKRSTVQFDDKGAPSVGLEFSAEGGKIFEEITKRNVGKPVGIFLDTQLLSAPTVQQVITGGQAVITGNFTLDEAKSLSISINSGALPVAISLVEQRNIGPSLGEQTIRASVIAGIVGLLAVILFMILYYGRLGFIATAALIIYGMISLSIFKMIPVVLTLPGIAGFILSIGMAVDSNILIFERIKEELRAGQDLRIAIRLGFGRAIDAIKDANFTTLLVAFILFNPLNWSFFPQFGAVRGFALTLAVGVATSLFTGVVITKRLIDIFYNRK